MSFLQKSSPLQPVLRWSIIFVGVILAVLLAISAFERYQVEKTMRERREAAEVELEALQIRHETLEEEIDYLSGARGVEEEIRQQFDVARPGEQVVVLVGNEDPPAPTTTSRQEEVEARWYEFWRLWR